MQDRLLVSLSAMGKEISTLRTQIIDLTTTNQAQKRDIQSLATIVCHLSTRPQLHPPITSTWTISQALPPGQSLVCAGPTNAYMQQAINQLYLATLPHPHGLL